MKSYSTEEFNVDIQNLTNQIKQSKIIYIALYGVPRGGAIVAAALSQSLNLPLITLFEEDRKRNPDKQILIVDDLVDSGTTRMKWTGWDFACLHKKKKASIPITYYAKEIANEWIEYFWESNEMPAEDAAIRLIQMIGEDINRDGLKETPKRFVKSWQHLFSGYKVNPGSIIKCFEGDGYNQIVLLRDIEMYSTCEHHILPFIGKAHIAYIPDKKVIGISKLARLLEIFSRRLQIQERICEQVTQAIMTHLQPLGAACVIEAEHLCMRMRGVQKQNSVMVTSSLKGVFLENLATREEFLRLIGK